jgi:hypothetical protein
VEVHVALRELNAICTTCRTPFRAKPRQSFLGFQQLTCPQAHRVVYPLTRGYRIAYWILAILIGFGLIQSAVKGQISLLWTVATILMIIGLIRDAKIRKQVAALKAAPVPRPSKRPMPSGVPPRTD